VKINHEEKMINKKLTSPEKNLSYIETSNFLSTSIGNNKKILEFGSNNYMLNTKNQNCKITRFVTISEHNQNIPEYVDETISENTDFFNIDKLLGTKKFDIIIIAEQFKDTNIFVNLLQKLQNYLEKNAYFLLIVPNTSFASLRLNFLNGIAPSQSKYIFHDSTTFLTLDSVLLLLDKVKLKITKLHRISQKFDLFKHDELNLSSYSNNLIDSVLKDPESETIQFILKVELGTLVNSTVREYVVKNFPKNIVSEQLQVKNEILEKTISDKDDFLKNVISEKDDFLKNVISEKDDFLKNVISEKDDFLKNVISEKDNLISGLEKTISDKDDFLKNVISEKDEFSKNVIKSYKSQLDEIHNSKIWRLVKKLDNLKG
jgi:hypothetical protein